MVNQQSLHRHEDDSPEEPDKLPPEVFDLVRFEHPPPPLLEERGGHELVAPALPKRVAQHARDHHHQDETVAAPCDAHAFLDDCVALEVWPPVEHCDVGRDLGARDGNEGEGRGLDVEHVGLHDHQPDGAVAEHLDLLLAQRLPVVPVAKVLLLLALVRAKLALFFVEVGEGPLRLDLVVLAPVVVAVLLLLKLPLSPGLLLARFHHLLPDGLRLRHLHLIMDDRNMVQVGAQENHRPEHKLKRPPHPVGLVIHPHAVPVPRVKVQVEEGEAVEHPLRHVGPGHRESAKHCQQLKVRDEDVHAPRRVGREEEHDAPYQREGPRPREKVGKPDEPMPVVEEAAPLAPPLEHPPEPCGARGAERPRVPLGAVRVCRVVLRLHPRP
mmetsp:Transcript_29106/g.73752  ORF Transcript_29106/g.73752 Transcript_29106/m.73752 type:complete len:383 (+) Transcript_29106:1244-2392(+)